MKLLPFSYIKSLRKFLIISTTVSILFINCAIIAVSYYTINNNTFRFFDVLLIESAEKLKVFLRGSTLYQNKLKEIQNDLNQCSTDSPCNIDPTLNEHKSINPYLSQWTDRFILRYRTESVFQVWYIQPEKLLLHSKFSPSKDFAEFVPGFQTVKYKNYLWRVYTQINPALNIAIQTAQREDLRDDLAEMIIQEHLYPVIIFTPLLLLLILLAIKFTTDSIKHVTNAIKKRDPKKLDLLNFQNTPVELAPLTEELNRLFNLINQSFEREQRFNSDAAHELKTPLAAIKSQTEVAIAALNSKYDTDNKNQQSITNLNNIIKGIDRANHLVSQLLILSRLSPDVPLEHVEYCYLDEITREVIADLINNASDKKIKISQEIKYKIRVTTMPPIIGNKALLSALAKNIIDNAIRYSGKNSKISIEIIISAKNILFKVSDTGPGLTEQLKQRVFDRFYRQPGTNTQGSGLGLSIVKLICELHNAEIQLSDNKKAKHGLCFSVIFKRNTT